MISDTLFDAINQIDEYLNEGWYDDEIKEEIIAVRDRMESLRVKLDTAPSDPKE